MACRLEAGQSTWLKEFLLEGCLWWSGSDEHANLGHFVAPPHRFRDDRYGGPVLLTVSPACNLMLAKENHVPLTTPFPGLDEAS